MVANFTASSLGSNVSLLETGQNQQRQAKTMAIADVMITYAAKGEVCVCFEEPLGVQLKQELKKKLWKDKYIKIFSLLILEMCVVKHNESTAKNSSEAEHMLGSRRNHFMDMPDDYSRVGHSPFPAQPGTPLLGCKRAAVLGKENVRNLIFLRRKGYQ